MSKSLESIDYVGKKYGKLTILELCDVVPREKGKKRINRKCICKCECGTIKTVFLGGLKNGDIKSCGCLAKEAQQKLYRYHGLKNTRLYNIWCGTKQKCYYSNHKNYQQYGGRGIAVCSEWCDDFMAFYNWAISNNYSDNLVLKRKDVNGNYEPNNCEWGTRRVPKINKITLVRHGYAQTKIYNVWVSMRQRCNNPNSSVYQRYGARGITVCEEWNDPKAFIEWAYQNGYKEGLSIDRKDNDGNYEPSNCTFSTSFEQQHNKGISSKNKSGAKGVNYLVKTGKWRARIKLHDKEISLGHFDTIEEATKARKAAEQKYWNIE